MHGTWPLNFDNEDEMTYRWLILFCNIKASHGGEGKGVERISGVEKRSRREG